MNDGAVATFVRFWWNFAQKLRTRNVRTLSLGSKSDDPFPYSAPIFYSRNALTKERSKYRSNEACGLIVEVESSNYVPREWLQVQNAITTILPPKTEKKWRSVHFQREYAWLSVWHMISQQPFEIEQWFQRITYRKLHIRSYQESNGDVRWP